MDVRSFLAPGIRFDGADISHHQDDAGPISWPALRAASWWIATKATQSVAYVDPTFAAHRAEMRDGFTHRIFYHWLSSTKPVEEQAAHFIRTVGKLEPGEGWMNDAEEGGVTLDKTLTFNRIVGEHYGRPGVTYTGAYVAGGTIWQSTTLRGLGGPMHLAAYTTEARAKSLPGVAAYPWDGWQYSSDGPVAGVTGRCDMNRIDNRSAYDRACGLHAPQPQPQPQPSGDDEMYLVQVRNDPAVVLINGDASWITHGVDDLTAVCGPVRTVDRSFYKHFWWDKDAPAVDYGNGPDQGPTKISDFRGRRPQPVAVVPPITIPPVTVSGAIEAELGAGGRIIGRVQ